MSFLAALAGVLPSAQAQERYDDTPLTQRFSMRIGGFLMQNFDTTVRFESGADRDDHQPLGGYGGNVRDLLILIEDDTSKHVGFGFGLNNYDMKITADVETLSGQFSESYLGLLGYMKVYSWRLTPSRLPVPTCISRPDPLRPNPTTTTSGALN